MESSSIWERYLQGKYVKGKLDFLFSFAINCCHTVWVFVFLSAVWHRSLIFLYDQNKQMSGMDNISCVWELRKIKDKFVTLHAMNVYGGVELQFISFLISVPVTDECSVSCAGRFTPGEKSPFTCLLRHWLGPRVGLDASEKRWISCLCRKSNYISSVVKPVASSLYQIQYPDSDWEFRVKY